ncbi:hypothetical protein BJF90_32630 [Pseudonocardia sp. CNS-004]|nr:hypothetical protein BJF90_32630 [Pseudonocardia sp. CNS-004]
MAAFMVDDCSRIARLGTRRWGPRFQAAYEQIASPATEKDPGSTEPAPVDAFADHLVHDALAAAALRPPVAISVA